MTVWQTGETFRVITFIQLNDVRAEKREALVAVAEVLRKASGVKIPMKDEQSFVILRRRKDLTKERALEELISQMAELQTKLKTLC